jgi:hypothetical protein
MVRFCKKNIQDLKKLVLNLPLLGLMLELLTIMLLDLIFRSKSYKAYPYSCLLKIQKLKGKHFVPKTICVLQDI